MLKSTKATQAPSLSETPFSLSEAVSCSRQNKMRKWEYE